MGQLGFYFDSTKCIGCRTCMMSCKDKNNTPLGIQFRKVQSIEGGTFPNPWLYFISMSCNHCANPKCVEVCPYQATIKRSSDGLVLINEELCGGAGCAQPCIEACPYGARTLNIEKNKMTKCDGCADLVLNYQGGAKPQCVAACAVGCLDFGDMETLKAKYGEWGSISALPDPGLTNPSFLIKPTVYAK